MGRYPPDRRIPEPQPAAPLWTLHKGAKCFDVELQSWSDGGCEVQFSCNGEFLYSYRHSNPRLPMGYAARVRIELEASGGRVEEPLPTPTANPRYPTP